MVDAFSTIMIWRTGIEDNEEIWPPFVGAFNLILSVEKDKMMCVYIWGYLISFFLHIQNWYFQEDNYFNPVNHSGDVLKII